MLQRRLALLTLAIAAGCHVPPPIAYDTADGRVRAHTLAEARSLAVVVAQQRSAIEALLPGLVDRPVEVWLEPSIAMRGDPPRHVAGYTLLERDAPVGRVRLDSRFADREQVVAHELVHALLGPAWRTLPGILEEGLCDWTAATSAGAVGDVLRANRRILARAALGRPIPFDFAIVRDDGVELYRERFLIGTDEPLDPSELAMALALPMERLGERYDRLPSSWYGVGLMLVERIAARHGIERLHRACAEAVRDGRAVVALDDLLGLAGLTRADLDRAGLVDALAEPPLPAEAWLRAVVEGDRAVTERLWARASTLVPGIEPVELLGPGRLVLVLEDGRRIDVAADARARAGIVDAWLAAGGLAAAAADPR